MPKVAASASPTARATSTPVLAATALLAEQEGTLEWVPPCLMVKSLRTEVVVVWAPNFVVSLESNGIHVIDQGMTTGLRKEVDIHFGDHVIFGGGSFDNVPTSDFQISQQSCPGPYYEVGLISYEDLKTAIP